MDVVGASTVICTAAYIYYIYIPDSLIIKWVVHTLCVSRYTIDTPGSVQFRPPHTS